MVFPKMDRSIKNRIVKKHFVNAENLLTFSDF